MPLTMHMHYSHIFQNHSALVMHRIVALGKSGFRNHGWHKYCWLSGWSQLYNTYINLIYSNSKVGVPEFAYGVAHGHRTLFDIVRVIVICGWASAGGEDRGARDGEREVSSR